MTMENFRNGEWHRFNSADCPVDTRDLVLVCHLAEGYPITSAEALSAASAQWPAVVAFRVTRAWRDPRVFWIADGQAFDTRDQAEATGHPVIQSVEQIAP